MLPLVVALVVAQVDAGPADAGPVDAGQPPTVCGTLSAEGACFGEVAAWCSEDNTGGAAAAADVHVEDCAGGACAVLDDVGAWCFAADGARCAFAAGAGATAHACGPVQAAPDPAWGCDLVDGCVPLATAGCGAGCVDAERVRLACSPFGQPVMFRCAGFGGACVGEGCVDLGVGAPCDERFTCAAGLACIVGACVADLPGALVDAGPGEPPAPPAPPPLCGAGAVTCLGPAALLLVAVRRGSRRARTTSPPYRLT
ncbi:MAG: hypothetical protein HYS27_09990 [Deltaproteobacteria bacterium]|nr:hypothetical protein [Deltaproteobacteria bacterium]